MKITLAMTTEFMAAQGKLQVSTQRKVQRFFERYADDPTATGFNFEKIEGGRLRSVRIDQSYRAIVHQEKKDNTLVCLWVDNHDEAYDWAHRHKVAIHPDTGIVQVYRTQAVQSDSSSTSDSLPTHGREGLFAAWRDRELSRVGVPEDLIPLVRSFDTTRDLDEHADDLPDDAYIMLSDLADDPDSYEDLVREIDSAGPVDDFKTALSRPSARKQFIIIDDDESLQKFVNAPLGEWRIYLHPTQRRLVEMNANGPIRVLGGAGTGKTVVAMHRARRLAAEVFNGPEDRILFLVFSINLVGDVGSNLKRMCTPEVLARIEVINIDAWFQRESKRLGFRWRVSYDDDQHNAFWDEAIDEQGFELGFSRAFVAEEFKAVVLGHGIERESVYLRVSRRGRGKCLQRAQRRKLWKVFGAYRALLSGANLRAREDAIREVRQGLAGKPSRYRSVIVDEAQDMTAEAMRLVRTIAPEGQDNDLMIVGDAHQRIYGRPLVLSRCGINIIGRGHRLRINYRTPEEVRACAVSVLEGVPFDDLDGSHDTIEGYSSLIHGIEPKIEAFDTLREEVAAILEHIESLQCADSLHRICLVARTNALVNRYVGALELSDIPTCLMAINKVDDLSQPGVRVGTMHRVKGLEFDHMIVAGINRGVLPMDSVLNRAADVGAREEVRHRARSLLYVASTRARRTLFISSHGAPSALLGQLRSGMAD